MIGAFCLRDIGRGFCPSLWFLQTVKDWGQQLELPDLFLVGDRSEASGMLTIAPLLVSRPWTAPGIFSPECPPHGSPLLPWVIEVTSTRRRLLRQESRAWAYVCSFCQLQAHLPNHILEHGCVPAVEMVSHLNASLVAPLWVLTSVHKFLH